MLPHKKRHSGGGDDDAFSPAHPGSEPGDLDEAAMAHGPAPPTSRPGRDAPAAATVVSEDPLDPSTGSDGSSPATPTEPCPGEPPSALEHATMATPDEDKREAMDDAAATAASTPHLTLYDKLKQRRARQQELREQQRSQQQQQPQSSGSPRPRQKQRRPPSPPSTNGASADAATDGIRVGARVAVYWAGEGAYFAGTVRKVRAERARPHYVVYDDGDRDWTDLGAERYRVLKDEKPRSTKPDDSSATSLSSRDCIRRKRPRCGSTMTSPSHGRPSASQLSDHRSPDDNTWVEEFVKRSDSDSETDEEEIMYWASKMFGIKLPPKGCARQPKAPPCGIEDPSRLSRTHIHIPISEKVKRRRQEAVTSPELVSTAEDSEAKRKEAMAMQEEEEAEKRKREANRPLTRAEIQEILQIEDCAAVDCSHYVRRSVRQPNRAALNTPGVRSLIDKLRNNDTDMIVLKLKKYINDPGTPHIVIDAVLDALEENTNCEALYIQNFNEGMRDEQVLRLARILQRKTCKIWCLNIGENYQVKMSTWEKFTKALGDTKITHMYASEHTITTAIKDHMRAVMRENRKKHDMHNNPDNLDTIIRCTHCWWNPINAKRLQPFLKKRGYDHILKDAETQGLKGTTSGAEIQ